MSDITKLLRAIASGTAAQDNKHDIIFTAAAARIEALEAALQECADDLEAEIKERYSQTLGYASQVKKYQRDMAVVERARAILTTAQPEAE